MLTSIVGTLVFSAFTVLIHRGSYPMDTGLSQKPTRDVIETGLLVVILLSVPFFRVSLFWFPDWLGVYFLTGITLPILFEWILRRRSLVAIGFRWPENRRVLAIVAVLLAIYLVSRLTQPDFFDGFEWRRFWSNSVTFALIEETLFRGMIQTRLYSLIGVARAWMASGLFFGFYHYYIHYLVRGITPNLENALALLFIVALGLLLGVLFAKTKSLLPCFLIHAVNNL